jgi:CRP-like cAMP-binding protein
MKAEAALQDLVAELDRCIHELARARERAEELLVQRRSGHTWTEIVVGEARPLVVERISTVLASLARVGSAWRREQAAALQAEDVSINRIAAMFGVTRQRISTLLREREDPSSDEAPRVQI